MEYFQPPHSVKVLTYRRVPERWWHIRKWRREVGRVINGVTPNPFLGPSIFHGEAAYTGLARTEASARLKAKWRWAQYVAKQMREQRKNRERYAKKQATERKRAAIRDAEEASLAVVDVNDIKDTP